MTLQHFRNLVKSAVLRVRLKDQTLESSLTESGKLYHTIITLHEKKYTLTECV